IPNLLFPGLPDKVGQPWAALPNAFSVDFLECGAGPSWAAHRRDPKSCRNRARRPSSTALLTQRMPRAGKRGQCDALDAVAAIVSTQVKRVLVRRLPIFREAKLRRLSVPVDERAAIDRDGHRVLPHGTDDLRRSILFEHRATGRRGVRADILAVDVFQRA